MPLYIIGITPKSWVNFVHSKEISLSPLSFFLDILSRSLSGRLCFCLFVWVDALRPRSTAEVMSGRSVILYTLLLVKPPRGR